ncbi:hypothetical protein V1278_001181 [Bradyrhizobium sp. AZCC 1577]
MFRRHCERSEAIHLATCRDMDCFVASLLAMTWREHYVQTASTLLPSVSIKNAA